MSGASRNSRTRAASGSIASRTRCGRASASASGVVRSRTRSALRPRRRTRCGRIFDDRLSCQNDAADWAAARKDAACARAVADAARAV